MVINERKIYNEDNIFYYIVKYGYVDLFKYWLRSHTIPTKTLQQKINNISQEKITNMSNIINDPLTNYIYEFIKYFLNYPRDEQNDKIYIKHRQYKDSNYYPYLDINIIKILLEHGANPNIRYLSPSKVSDGMNLIDYFTLKALTAEKLRRNGKYSKILNLLTTYKDVNTN